MSYPFLLVKFRVKYKGYPIYSVTLFPSFIHLIKGLVTDVLDSEIVLCFSHKYHQLDL
jgi:hypothetical protein